MITQELAKLKKMQLNKHLLAQHPVERYVLIFMTIAAGALSLFLLSKEVALLSYARLDQLSPDEAWFLADFFGSIPPLFHCF